MLSLWFKNNCHEKLFNEFLTKHKSGPTANNEKIAAIYTLAAIENRAILNYITDNAIDFAPLLEQEPLSSGEHALAKLAATLFNSVAWPVTIDEAFRSLDPNNLRVAIQALQIKY